MNYTTALGNNDVAVTKTIIDDRATRQSPVTNVPVDQYLRTGLCIGAAFTPDKRTERRRLSGIQKITYLLKYESSSTHQARHW
jgi:hypothetical protein